jgi:hypothetical protein
MANVNKVIRKPVYIDIGDGKQRQLKYTLNSFALMEDKYGTIDDAMSAMEKGSVKAVRFALWAGLVHQDAELTEEYVGSMIDLSELETIATKMNEAMIGDLPEQAAKTNPNQ